MYKTIKELREMSIKEIAQYVNQLEQEDEIAKKNGVEYQNWCMNELDEVLEKAEISLDKFAKMLTIEKAN